MNDKEIIEMADQADRMSNAEETDKNFIFHFARLIEVKVREEDEKQLAEYLSSDYVAEQVIRKGGAA